MAPGAVGRHRRHVVEAVVGDSHAVALVEAEVDHLEAAGLLVADHHHVVVVVASHVAAGEVDLGAAVGGSKQVRECTQDPALLPRSGRRSGRKLHTSVFLTTWVSAQPDTSLRQPHRTSRMPRGPYPLVKHCGPGGWWIMRPSLVRDHLVMIGGLS